MKKSVEIREEYRAGSGAASISMVPDPHMGSRSGIPGCQPVVLSRPAARFSRSGASPVSCRHPRLNRDSPEVSRYKVTLWASTNPAIRISGVRVLMEGRVPVSFRNRSTTPSLIRNVVKFRLFSGDLIAVTSIRRVFSTPNHFSHGCFTVR